MQKTLRQAEHDQVERVRIQVEQDEIFALQHAREGKYLSRLWQL